MLRSRRQAEAGRWMEGDGAALKVAHKLYRLRDGGVLCLCCGLVGPATSYVGHPCGGAPPALTLIRGGKAG